MSNKFIDSDGKWAFVTDFHVQAVGGNTAGTNIALAGVVVDKTSLVGVLEYDPNGGGPGIGKFFDRTAEASVTSDGNIQLDLTDTSGHELIVTSFTTG